MGNTSRSTQPDVTPLRRARLLRGVTLPALADTAKCDAGNLSRWERGKSRPGLEVAKRIVDFLGEDIITRDQVLFPEFYPVDVKKKKPSRSVRLQEAI